MTESSEEPVITAEIAKLLDALAEKDFELSEPELRQVFALLAPHTRLSAAASFSLFDNWRKLPDMHRATHFLNGLFRCEWETLPTEVLKEPIVAQFFEALERFEPGYLKQESIC